MSKYKNMTKLDLQLKKADCEMALHPMLSNEMPPTGLYRKLLKEEIKSINKELKRR